jgi:hypothetical protein
MEVYKDISNYEGVYRVSNKGNVLSIRYGRLLKPDNSTKYSRVTLSLNNNTKRIPIHRLVADAFINNENNLNLVNHIDENKRNNNSENLQYISHRNNVSYSATKKSISKVNGVHWIDRMKTYQCSVYLNGKKYYLGSTKDIVVAENRVINFKTIKGIL